MSDGVAQVLVLAGSVFVLLAGIGVLRMPDIYMRLSTVTKGATMGIFLLLCGATIELYTPVVLVKACAIMIFGLTTSPVAAHLISRAAYFQGASLWDGTVVDELNGQYEWRDHELFSPQPGKTLAGSVLGEKSTEPNDSTPDSTK